MNKPPAMSHLHDVIDFAFVGDYVLRVRFDDGVERIIDFAPILLGPLFGPLHDPSLFRQVRVDRDLGTLVWPNGADIDPTVLYDWLQHVDAIVQRRRQRFAADAVIPSNAAPAHLSSPLVGAEQDTPPFTYQQSAHALPAVAEPRQESYGAERLPEDACREPD